MFKWQRGKERPLLQKGALNIKQISVTRVQAVEKENIFIFCKECSQPAITESESKYPELSLIGSALSGLQQHTNSSPLDHISIYTYRRSIHHLGCEIATKKGKNGWHFHPASLDRHQATTQSQWDDKECLQQNHSVEVGTGVSSNHEPDPYLLSFNYFSASHFHNSKVSVSLLTKDKD